jgi:glutathione S-transferase
MASPDPNPAPPTTPAAAPTLHHLESSQSLRVLWALEELAAINSQQFHLKTYPRIKARADPALKKIHPLGKSPVLVVPHIDGRDGEVTLAESRVILHFLSDAYGKGIWTPTTLEDKMRDDYFTEFANTSLGALYQLMLVFGMIPKQSPFLIRPLMGVVSNGAISMLKKEVEGPHRVMEEALSEEKPWFAGARIGLADFAMSWQLDVAGQRGYLDQKEFPKIAAWAERVHARPAYKKARERGGAYDLVDFGL